MYDRPFRWWVQSVMPLVFDDSLSYYEVLAKLTKYIEGLTGDVEQIEKILATIEGIEDVTQFTEFLERIQAEIGNLENLQTDTKASLVSAINEVALKADIAYWKPPTGIPESDLSQEVQDKLNKTGEDTKYIINNKELKAAPSNNSPSDLGLGTYTVPSGGIPWDTLSDDVKSRINQGGSGTTDYSDLNNKPQINGHTLNAGNNTTESLGIGTYSKPNGGIPESDLSAEVQEKLNTSGGIADNQNTFVASRDYEPGELVYINGTLYKIKYKILTGTNMIPGNNIETTDISAELERINSEIDSLQSGAGPDSWNLSATVHSSNSLDIVNFFEYFNCIGGENYNFIVEPVNPSIADGYTLNICKRDGAIVKTEIVTSNIEYANRFRFTFTPSDSGEYFCKFHRYTNEANVSAYKVTIEYTQSQGISELWVQVNAAAELEPRVSAVETLVGQQQIDIGSLNDAVSEHENQIEALMEDVEVIDGIESDVNKLTKKTDNIERIVALDDVVDIDCPVKESGYVTWFSGATVASANFDASDYIDISQYYEISYKRAKSTISNPDTGIAFYDENKVYLYGVRSASNQTENGYEESLYTTLVPFKAKYARFSMYKNIELYGEFYACGKSWLYEESRFFNVNPPTHEGFYSSSGVVQEPTDDKEIYTDKLPCFDGVSYLIDIDYITETHAMVIMVNEWTDGDVFSRTTVESRTLRSGCYAYTPASNIAEVSFALRTYDDADYRIKSNCDLLSLYNYIKNNVNAMANVSYPFSEHINKGVNHRGYNRVAPEETLPAYQLSVEHDFKFVECDVRFTSDGVPVLLHDATVDRTSNGTGNIADMTFAQARELDFGSWKSETYAGTKIMSFEEFIVFCKATGIYPYAEIEPYHLSVSNIELLNNIAKRYGMEKCVTWIASDIQNLRRMTKVNPHARCGLVVFNQPTEAKISGVPSLYTGFNEVFLDCDINYLSDALTLAKNANIPLEFWIVNYQNVIESLDDYVTGVTSDNLNFETIKKNQALGN